VGLDLLEQLALGGDHVPERRLEVRLGRGICAAGGMAGGRSNEGLLR
jgi:hypothetical protein